MEVEQQQSIDDADVPVCEFAIDECLVTPNTTRVDDNKPTVDAMHPYYRWAFSPSAAEQCEVTSLSSSRDTDQQNDAECQAARERLRVFRKTVLKALAQQRAVKNEAPAETTSPVAPPHLQYFLENTPVLQHIQKHVADKYEDGVFMLSTNDILSINSLLQKWSISDQSLILDTVVPLTHKDTPDVPFHVRTHTVSPFIVLVRLALFFIRESMVLSTTSLADDVTVDQLRKWQEETCDAFIKVLQQPESRQHIEAMFESNLMASLALQYPDFQALIILSILDCSPTESDTADNPHA